MLYNNFLLFCIICVGCANSSFTTKINTMHCIKYVKYIKTQQNFHVKYKMKWICSYKKKMHSVLSILPKINNTLNNMNTFMEKTYDQMNPIEYYHFILQI